MPSLQDLTRISAGGDLASLSLKFIKRRSGIIPLDLTSDVAGPLARTVEDAVRVFEATVGVDTTDNLTTLQTQYTVPSNYTQFLQGNALRASFPYHLQPT